MGVSWQAQQAEAGGFPRSASAADDRLKYGRVGFKRQSHSPSLI